MPEGDSAFSHRPGRDAVQRRIRPFPRGYLPNPRAAPQNARRQGTPIARREAYTFVRRTDEIRIAGDPSKRPQARRARSEERDVLFMYVAATRAEAQRRIRPFPRGYLPNPQVAPQNARRQGAQIARREAYTFVRRTDERCRATQHPGIFRCRPRSAVPIGKPHATPSRPARCISSAPRRRS